MKKVTVDSQSKMILRYLETRKRGLTPLDALEKFGCMRLSARIHDLRQEGHEIETYMEEEVYDDGTKKRYARYFLKH